MGSPPPPDDGFICDALIGNRCFRLILAHSPEMDGWTYSVYDVNSSEVIVPASPVPNPETGKLCAESIINDNFAFSHIEFHWVSSGTPPK